MFLQRPKPYSDESLESFFIRVANKNGYDDVHRFLEATKRFLQTYIHRCQIELKNLEHRYESCHSDGKKI